MSLSPPQITQLNEWLQIYERNKIWNKVLRWSRHDFIFSGQFSFCGTTQWNGSLQRGSAEHCDVDPVAFLVLSSFCVFQPTRHQSGARVVLQSPIYWRRRADSQVLLLSSATWNHVCLWTTFSGCISCDFEMLLFWKPKARAFTHWPRILNPPMWFHVSGLQESAALPGEKSCTQVNMKQLSLMALPLQIPAITTSTRHWNANSHSHTQLGLPNIPWVRVMDVVSVSRALCDKWRVSAMDGS